MLSASLKEATQQSYFAITPNKFCFHMFTVRGFMQST